MLTEISSVNADLPEASHLVAPCFDTFRSRIHDLDEFYVTARREGVDAARRKFPSVSQGVDADMPGWRVEMDEWEIQLKVILGRAGVWQTLSKKARKLLEKKRLYACMAIDCASRVVLGASLSTGPSTDNVLACLRMVVSDKSAHAEAVGARSPWDMAVRPRKILTDGGSTFTNDRVKEALAGLRVDWAVTIAAVPQMRGTIERFFSTVHRSLLCRLPGRTFSDVVAKGDYPDDRVALDVDDMIHVLFRWIIDEYHNRPHSGLAGETPRNCWTRLVGKFGLRPRPGPDEVRAFFGKVERCTLSSEGIELQGLSYRSPSLGELLRRDGAREVDVRMDLDDVGHVSVMIDGAWETVACATGGLDRVSLREYQAVKRALAARFGEEAKVERPIVEEALRDIRTRMTKVIEVIGLDDDLPSDGTIRHAERGLDAGFVHPRHGDGDGPAADLLADVTRAAPGNDAPASPGPRQRPVVER